jgi:hypothetical protein
MAKQKAEAADPVEQVTESVETVAVLAETPPGVQLPRYKMRPLGSGGDWRIVEAESIEDAIRAYNGNGNGGTVYTRKKLEIEAV